MQRESLLGLCMLLGFMGPVFTSHFRGGYITWKPDPDADAANQIIVTWRMSWRRSESSSNCDKNIINSRGLIGSGNIKCDQCATSDAGARVICTDFNLQNDWSSGVNTAYFQLSNPRSTISYAGGDWITVLNGGGSASWAFIAHVDLNRRPDNNKLNTSPKTMEPPIVYTQQGCPITINVPVVDTDGDVIRCRWPNSEDGDLIRPSKDVLTNLDEANCRVTVVHNTDAYVGIALAIEDFIPPYTTSSQALSTVPLQFLVKVNNINPPLPCSQKPVFVAPTPKDNAVFNVVTGSEIDVTIRARGSSPSLPVTAFTTISPQGLTRSDITDGGNNEKFINIRWNPTNSLPNDIELFCFSADDNRQSSEQRCVTFNVTTELEPPVIVNTPSSQRVNTDFNSATNSVWWTPPTASDNSGEPVTLTSDYIPGDNFDIGNTLVTYTAVDVSGNRATYSFEIIVTDVEPPALFNIPVSQKVNTDTKSATAVVWWTPPTARDNSGEPATLTSDYNSGDNFTIGITTVTYTAVDFYGNVATYSFAVNVIDVESPVIVNTPYSQHVNMDTDSATASVWWTPPTTSDNSGEPVTLTSDFHPGDTFTIGNTAVTYTALDAYGNTATDSFLVVVTIRKQQNMVLWMILAVSSGLVISFILILVGALLYRLKNSETDSEETGNELRAIRPTGTTMSTRPNEYHYQQSRPSPQPEYQDLKTGRPESCYYDDVPIEESLYQNYKNVEMSNLENDDQNEEEHYYDLSESEQRNNLSRQMVNRSYVASDEGELFQNFKF